MVPMTLRIKPNLVKKKAPGPINGSGRSCLQFALDLLAPARESRVVENSGRPARWSGRLREFYWTTVTARRFWLQHEMSLQIATGRSLPKDWLVMRCWLTRLDTR